MLKHAPLKCEERRRKSYRLLNRPLAEDSSSSLETSEEDESAGSESEYSTHYTSQVSRGSNVEFFGNLALLERIRSRKVKKTVEERINSLQQFVKVFTNTITKVTTLVSSVVYIFSTRFECSFNLLRSSRE